MSAADRFEACLEEIHTVFSSGQNLLWHVQVILANPSLNWYNTLIVGMDPMLRMEGCTKVRPAAYWQSAGVPVEEMDGIEICTLKLEENRLEVVSAAMYAASLLGFDDSQGWLEPGIMETIEGLCPSLDFPSLHEQDRVPALEVWLDLCTCQTPDPDWKAVLKSCLYYAYGKYFGAAFDFAPASFQCPQMPVSGADAYRELHHCLQAFPGWFMGWCMLAEKKAQTPQNRHSRLIQKARSVLAGKGQRKCIRT